VSHEAFEAARADGVIDTFLAMPAPRAEQRRSTTTSVPSPTTPRRSRWRCPRQYMFKDVPHYDELDDSVVEVLRLLDQAQHHMMVPGLQEGPASEREEHPDRFRGMTKVRPQSGHGRRACARARSARRGARIAAHTWGAGLNPQVPNDDKKMYPIYAKCVELDIPISLYGGVPGAAHPVRPLDVATFDEICWFFPELRIVVRHGGEPWTALMWQDAVEMARTSTTRRRHSTEALPGRTSSSSANKRGADKMIYAATTRPVCTSTASSASSPTCRSATTSGPSSSARTPSESSTSSNYATSVTDRRIAPAAQGVSATISVMWRWRGCSEVAWSVVRWRWRRSLGLRLISRRLSSRDGGTDRLSLRRERACGRVTRSCVAARVR